LDTIQKTSQADPEVDETTALLIRARAFIERGWCRETAQDANGDLVQARSERAVRWCAVGALMAAGVDNHGFWDHPATLRLIAAIGGAKIPDFNDAQATAGPVLAAFDRAIVALDSMVDRTLDRRSLVVSS
jgi:hypothetical protein